VFPPASFAANPTEGLQRVLCRPGQPLVRQRGPLAREQQRALRGAAARWTLRPKVPRPRLRGVPLPLGAAAGGAATGAAWRRRRLTWRRRRTAVAEQPSQNSRRRTMKMSNRTQHAPAQRSAKPLIYARILQTKRALSRISRDDASSAAMVGCQQQQAVTSKHDCCMRGFWLSKRKGSSLAAGGGHIAGNLIQMAPSETEFTAAVPCVRMLIRCEDALFQWSFHVTYAWHCGDSHSGCHSGGGRRVQPLPVDGAVLGHLRCSRACKHSNFRSVCNLSYKSGIAMPLQAWRRKSEVQ